MIFYDLLLGILIIVLIWWLLSFVLVPLIKKPFEEEYQIKRKMLSNPRRPSHPEAYIVQIKIMGFFWYTHPQMFNSKIEAQTWIDFEQSKTKLQQERMTKHAFLSKNLKTTKKKKRWLF
jgi:hypothetical protein